MTRCLRLTAPILVAAALSALPARAQSAWTQPEDASFFQLSVTHIGPYKRLFESGGSSSRTGREITETSLEFYGEYGVLEGWTLLGNVPFRSVDAGSKVSSATIDPVTIDSDTEYAFGNLLLGLRKQLATGDTDFAAQVDVELPTSTTDDSSGLSTGLDAYTVRPWICAGRGFENAYAQVHLGVSLRTDDYSNDWRIGTEAGYHVTEDLLVAGTLDLVDSFKDGSVHLDRHRRETGLYVDEQEWFSVGIKGLYQLSEHIGLSGAVRGAFWGNNVPESPFLSFGIYFRY